MAVVAKTYTALGEALATGSVALDSVTLRVALLDATAAYSDSDTVFGDLEAVEVSGTGYTAGGEELTTVTVTADDGVVTLGADDVTWTTATVDAAAAAVYVDETVKTLVAYVDFNDTVSASAEDFVLDFSAGVLTLTVGV